MTVLGNIMTLTGGVFLSIAGAAPGLDDTWKARYIAGGVAAAACGGLLTVTAYIAGWWNTPTKS
jgi:hypothetical protein